MADSWGPVTKPAGNYNEHAPGTDGEVVQPHVSGGSAPRHPVNYSATDSRHGHERDMMGWPSIDQMSGPVTATDWENSAGRFPDGPGAWRQT